MSIKILRKDELHEKCVPSGGGGPADTQLVFSQWEEADLISEAFGH